MTQFVTKGDAPLTAVQLHKRTQQHLEQVSPRWQRERSLRKGGPNLAALNALMAAFEGDDDINKANNTFNWQLQEYGNAVARLARYRLADGRPEIWEDQPTGEYDGEGNEVMESVLVQSAVEPLDATVEVTTYDVDGNGTTETVANPLIVQDDAERAAAQAVVDTAPDEVSAFAQG
jgi:hypothetical protein